MSAVKLLLISLLQLHWCCFCQPSHLFLALPTSAIVSVRTNVTLECRVNSTISTSIKWDFMNTSLVKDQPIFFSARITERLKSRYRINGEGKGHYDLIIDSVDHEYAGRYICKTSGSEPKLTAELTVIDSDPVCGMNMTSTATDHVVSLWCEINSTGFLIPHMKWTKGNDALINNTTQNTTINGLTKTTSFVRLQLQPQDNNAIERITVKCTTSFIWKNGSNDNVPRYEHVWGHTLTLPHGVRNITIQPNASNFQIGDQLMCYAEGNPEPAYTWTHLNTSRIQTGSVIILNDSSLSIGSMHVFVCTAENRVAGKRTLISETISILIIGKTYATADSNPPQLEVWIIAAVGGSVIIIIIILCFVFRCRKKKAKENTSSTALPLNAGSSGNTENTNREAEGKRLPKTQREEVEHGTENVEVYETFADRPTTSMQSATYCELNLTEQEKSKTKSTRTIETYETLANRPSASMQSETYCELNLLNQDEPKSKPQPSAVFEDERQEYHTIGDEYQTIVEYETLANRPSPAVQSETYCELQIVKKKKDKKK